MKKVTLLMLLMLGMNFAAEAQVNKHALGVRLNGSTAYGAELSYQLGLSDRNRFEFDLGTRWGGSWYRHDLTICFHWDFNIMSGWNWYIGPGIQTGFYAEPNDPADNRFLLAAGGQAGMEFDFSVPFEQVPVLVSVDVRPMFDFFRPPLLPIWIPSAAASARYIIQGKNGKSNPNPATE